MEQIERIIIDDCEHAIVIRAAYRSDGIEFFTPDDYSQQLAYMHHPAGKVIEPHIHNIVKRSVQLTQEVLLVRSGSVRVDFYNDKQAFVKSLMLGAGDVIMLATGGHGFEMLDDCEMIEIKQGPYLGDQDKVRFVPCTQLSSTTDQDTDQVTDQDADPVQRNRKCNV